MKRFISIIRAPWLIPIVALAAAARFYDLTKSAIWHDEGFTMMLSGRGPAAIWAGSARDVHPPLYYLLLHGWRNLFGDSIYAVRSLSALAGIALVVLIVWLVRLIATRRAAILAGVFAALMPILVRYSQEVRMYGLLGVFVLAATIALVYYINQPTNNKYLVYFTLAMTAAFYTHYFAVLALAALWFYLLLRWDFRNRKMSTQLILRPYWLLANVAIFILYLPWLPNLYAQLTRGQGLGWIPKVTIYSLPSTVWQFITFTDGRRLPLLLYIIIPLVILAVTAVVIKKDRTEQKYSWLIVSYVYVPILALSVLSLAKPLFIDRYLVFAAAGIPILVAMAIDRFERLHHPAAYVCIGAVVAIELVGLRNVYHQANHQMNVVANFVNKNYARGDVIISGELYTYFDFSYYNKSGFTPLLYTPLRPNGTINQPNGYGESGLLYKQASQIYLNSYRDLPFGIERVWLVGKTGHHSYYDQVPYYWQLIGEREAGYSEVRLYQIQ